MSKKILPKLLVISAIIVIAPLITFFLFLEFRVFMGMGGTPIIDKFVNRITEKKEAKLPLFQELTGFPNNLSLVAPCFLSL